MEMGWIFSRLYRSDPQPELWLTYQRDDSLLRPLVFGKISKDRRGSAQKYTARQVPLPGRNGIRRGRLTVLQGKRWPWEQWLWCVNFFPRATGQKKPILQAAEWWWALGRADELIHACSPSKFEVFDGEVRMGIRNQWLQSEFVLLYTWGIQDLGFPVMYPIRDYNF